MRENKDLHKAKKFWDRTASSYDREERKDEAIVRLIAHKTLPYLNPEAMVLDFGCGTGLFANRLSGYVNQIDGIDLSSKMIEIAQTKTENQKVANVHYTQATIFDETLRPASFDIILAFHVLHLALPTEAIIQRIHHVLKPGGLLIAATPCMAEKPLMNGFFSFLSSLGLAPKITAFKHEDLTELFTSSNFKLIENGKLEGTSNQYFMVGAKSDLNSPTS